MAPTGSGTLVIKVVPLILPTWGLFRRRVRSHQVMSLLVWLYVLEGLVRSWSDSGWSRWFAVLEVVLSLLLFTVCALYIRRLRARQNMQ